MCICAALFRTGKGGAVAFGGLQVLVRHSVDPLVREHAVDQQLTVSPELGQCGIASFPAGNPVESTSKYTLTSYALPTHSSVPSVNS